MKKLLALILALTMVLSFAACGGADEESSADASVESTESVESVESTESVESVESVESTESVESEEEPAESEEESTAEESTEAPAGATMGQTLLNAFKAEKEANPAITAEELANVLVTNPVIQFMGGAMPIAPDTWLAGFDAETMGGFESGATFGPMMGSIAFIGYVFELAEGADVEAFKASLTENANPAWQICVTAAETIVDNVGNTVFFVMCPEPEPEMDENGEILG